MISRDSRIVLILACTLLFPGADRLEAAQFKFPNQTLTVPDGFEVELISNPSLVDRPVSASFDELGRLYVTDSSGSNDKPDKQLAEKPHRVVRLEDSNGDGKFDKTIVFADKLMFPEGCLWFDGSLYVAAPPSIWKLTDTNHDGIADVREEWHQGKTLTGCANDLHGPFLGLDGWIYWCKGAFAEQRYELPNGKPFVSRAAHIFRSRPDHTGLEPVLTGGMDNPVGVAFTAEGERILCGTFFAPHEPGHRDGLIHAIYGGVYGKINDVNDSHKKTGDLMPVMTHMGPAAPCAVIRYESRAFGDEYRDNLFVCAFNLHKVSRHILEPNGATFKTKDSDFLVSDNPDFHPTDVIEDADGSLIVLNTGGWYKICCPTSQLSKPDVLGAIYRIRRIGARKLDDPRGLKIAWSKLTPAGLADRLSDPRIFAQRQAIAELGKRGDAAVPILERVLKVPPIQGFEKGSDLTARRQNAIWALTRIDSAAARDIVRTALKNNDPAVRSAALQSASLHRDGKAADDFQPRTALETRLYLELLGRTGRCEDRLVSCLRAIPDTAQFLPSAGRVLQHSLSYALIESGSAKTAQSLLDANNHLSLWPAALIALDQMDDGRLEAKNLSTMLSCASPDLRQAATWVAMHHPEWGDALADFFRVRLAALTNAPASVQDELAHQLSQFAQNQAIQTLMASVFEDGSASTRPLILQAMAGASLKQAPPAWVSAIRSSLTRKDEIALPSAINAARVLSQVKSNAPAFTDQLLNIARDGSQATGLRLEALAALPAIRSLDPQLFHFLCSNVDPAKPVLERSAAASVLAKARLNDDQLLALADTVKSAGPLEMTKLLGAFEHSTSETVGLKLLSGLKEAKGLSSLRPDSIKTVTAKYPASVQAQGQEIITLLNVDAAKQTAHIDELLKDLKDGDVRHGQDIFNSQKAACFSCHAMGYLGGKAGPDLTSIGQVRTERDLLESIIYPSASFVRSYEPFLVATKADESFTGVLKKDAPDEIVLVTGPDKEVRIARADITELRPSTVSIMPAGLEQQLTKQELGDLLAFLESTKWGPR